MAVDDSAEAISFFINHCEGFSKTIRVVLIYVFWLCNRNLFWVGILIFP